MVNPTYSPKSHVSVMLDEIINLINPEKGEYLWTTFEAVFQKKFFNFQILR